MSLVMHSSELWGYPEDMLRQGLQQYWHFDSHT